jgi:hypothetical protein
MATGTAQLLFGAAHRKHGGIAPFLSMWLVEGTTAHWRVDDAGYGPLTWVPRSADRVVADALVLLLGLTTTPRDPVPVALTEMAGGLTWSTGNVDLTTWRCYDTEGLDALVAASEPGGKVVLSVLPEASVPEESLAVLEHLDWDVDVLTTRLSRRRGDRDLHQAPPPGLPGPALPEVPHGPRQSHGSQRQRWWT